MGIDMIRKPSTIALIAILAAGSARAETLVLEVKEAAQGFDPASGQPVVSFKLTGESGRAFGKFTADRVGEQIQLKVGGRVVTEPVIRDPIYGGQLQISGNLTVDEATVMAVEIASGQKAVEVTGSEK